MPTFYGEDFDIDVEEFVSACNKKEIEELLKLLYEDGYLEKSGYKNVNNHRITIDRAEYLNALDTLDNAYYSVSQEDIEIIKNIAKKY